jgi:hypothetical protein
MSQSPTATLLYWQSSSVLSMRIASAAKLENATGDYDAVIDLVLWRYSAEKIAILTSKQTPQPANDSNGLSSREFVS